MDGCLCKGRINQFYALILNLCLILCLSWSLFHSIHTLARCYLFLYVYTCEFICICMCRQKYIFTVLLQLPSTLLSESESSPTGLGLVNLGRMTGQQLPRVPSTQFSSTAIMCIQIKSGVGIEFSLCVHLACMSIKIKTPCLCGKHLTKSFSQPLKLNFF